MPFSKSREERCKLYIKGRYLYVVAYSLIQKDKNGLKKKDVDIMEERERGKEMCSDENALISFLKKDCFCYIYF